jgi:hypothetical protein
MVCKSQNFCSAIRSNPNLLKIRKFELPRPRARGAIMAVKIKGLFKILPVLGAAFLATGFVSLKSVTGASYFDTTSRKIYAGFAGVCASPSSGSTCNTCTDAAGGGIKPCNQKSIHGALTVNFSFQSSTDLTGKQIALFVGSSEATNTQVSSGTGAAASSDMSLSTTWTSFCSGTTGLNADCSVSSSADQTVSTSKNFYIGADENNTGAIESTEKLPVLVTLHSISRTNTGLHTQATCPDPAAASGYGLCQYALEAGDNKLIIQGAKSKAQSTPPTDSPAFSAVAFFAYIQPNNSAIIVPTSVSNGEAEIVVKNIESATDFTLTPDDYLNGLSNYSRYCVIAGQMNLAQNIFAFTTTGFTATNICQSPSEVVGLLDDKHCFISTAAFGSQMSSEVQTFRQFRNTFLLNNYWGGKFIKAYYKFGPAAAEFISGSEILKSVARGFLYPALGFSWIALNYGIFPAMLVLLLSLILVFNFSKKIRSIIKPRAVREKFN